MKLSEFIKKYEPLGWTFEYTRTNLDDFWSFKSPRMKEYRGFLDTFWDTIETEKVEVDEEKTLKAESNYYIWQTYSKKIDDAFKYVKDDVFKQLENLDEKKQEIPDEVKVSFTLKLK